MNVTDVTTGHNLRVVQILFQFEQIKSVLIKKNNAHVFFTNIYILVTECLLDFISAIEDESHLNHRQNALMDSTLVENLIVYFGQRYIDAFTAYSQQSENVPLPWKLTFQKSTRGNDAGAAMLLGAITHISYDLPVVLATKLPNGEILFDVKSEKALITFCKIDDLIANLLPEMIKRTRQLQQQLNCGAHQRVQQFRYGIVHHQLGASISRRFVYTMIRLTRQESRWLQIRLLKQECDNEEIEKIVCNRIRFISGKGSILSFFVFLSYGLVARQANRTNLVPAYSAGFREPFGGNRCRAVFDPDSNYRR